MHFYFHTFVQQQQRADNDEAVEAAVLVIKVIVVRKQPTIPLLR